MKGTLSITQTMIPSQRHTEQGMVNPKEFSPTDWAWNPIRTNSLDWHPTNALQSNQNMFAKNEPYQNVKNGMFNPLTGREPIFGHCKYFLNPLDQEQTNGQSSAYEMQKQTRFNDNMDPNLSIRCSPYMPTTYPINDWKKVYIGSQSTRPFDAYSMIPNQSFNPLRG